MNRRDSTAGEPDGVTEGGRSRDDGGTGDSTISHRRTVLTGAVGLLASASLAGCTIQADTEGIEIDFGGDEDTDDAGHDDTTSPGAAPTDTPTDGDGGTTPTATQTPSPTGTPIDLLANIQYMGTTYGEVYDTYGSEAARQIELGAGNAMNNVYDAAQYVEFIENSYDLQLTVSEEVADQVTPSSLDAYDDAVADLADELEAGADAQVVARAQNAVTDAAVDFEAS